MRNNVFDLDQDSTIISVLAVRDPPRASRAELHTLAVKVLAGFMACVLILYASGGASWP